MEEQKLLNNYKTLYNERKYEEALILINRIIQINQSEAKYYNKKGLCYVRLGKLNEELECFDKAVKLNDKNAVYLTNKAAALVKLGEYDEAHKLLDLSVELDNKYSLSYLWKGKACYEQSLYYKSLEYLDKCLMFNPKQLYTHYYKGLNLKKMNLFEDSKIEFDLEININPDCANCYNEKASILMKMKKYEEALLELDKALSKNPNESSYLNNKAFCLIRLDKLDKALIETDKSPKDDCDALRNKAEIYYKKNKPEEALNFINKGFKETSEFYELKGCILLKLKKEDEAMECFMTAIRIKDNSNKRILENMGLIMSNYKASSPQTELKNLKTELDDCIKFLTEIKNPQPIKSSLQTFSYINLPLDWGKIIFDLNNILNYQEIHERFICKICLSLVKSPKSCQSCDDLYCSECLMKTLKINNSCPICRATPFAESRINFIVKEVYNSIKITCPLKCGENFGMENFDKHLSSCKTREKHYECNLCKCHLKSDKEVEVHKELCSEIIFVCKMCNRNFKNKAAQDHMKSCDQRNIVCGKCKCVIPLKYKGSHKGHPCDSLKFVSEIALKIQKKFFDLGVF